MGDLERNGQELSACQQYRTLLAVSDAIVLHRDLEALFHDLAGRLHLVVRFDYLACSLHDAANNTMRLHVLETTEPIPTEAPRPFSIEEDPAGSVLQTQYPQIVSMSLFMPCRLSTLANASGAGWSHEPRLCTRCYKGSQHGKDRKPEPAGVTTVK